MHNEQLADVLATDVNPTRSRLGLVVLDSVHKRVLSIVYSV